MAASDKNIVISPQRGSTTLVPTIVFTGDGNDPITLSVLDGLGNITFSGSSGQLFSITNNLTSGSIFSVNDVSGIPSIDVNADGTVSIAAFGGNVAIGKTTASSKLDVAGTVTATAFSGPLTGNASTATKLETARTINGVSFDGTGNIDVPPPVAANVSDVLTVTSNALSAVDAGSDQVPFWDDSASKLTYLTLGSSLSISGTTINANAVSTVKITTYGSGSGTFTTDSNTLFAQVFVTGGGGGGGGADSDGASGSASGGGGGGGTAIKWLTADQLGSTATYSVGEGGTAGSVTGGNGGNGTDSTFTCTGTGSIVLTGTGGGGGTGTGSGWAANTSAFNGGNGGIPIGGDILHTGLDGMFGIGAAQVAVAGGNGGASYWGGGANGPTRTSAGATAGSNATQYGAGGSGAVNTNSTAGVVGGTGAAGIILVVEYLKQ